MGVFSILTSQGFGYALVQRKDLQITTVHSIFWFLSFVGFALSGLVLLSSPVLARFYGQPAVTPLMSVMALSLVSGMTGAVPNALLQRALRFREINLVSICGTVVSAGLGIGLAVVGYGYWALILPTVGASISVACFAFLLSRYRPMAVFRWRDIGTTLHFGGSLTAANLLYYLAAYADSLVMARYWTPTDFGLYSFAVARSRQFIILIGSQISGTILPAFSQMQDDGARMRSAYLRGTHVICLAMFPVHVLIIGIADPLIPWIFGQQWREAVPVFQILAAFAFVSGPSTLVTEALLSLNCPQGPLYYNMLRMAVILPTLIWLGVSQQGILITAAVLMVLWIPLSVFYLAYFYRRIHVQWAESWDSLNRLVVATIAMALTLMVSRHLQHTMGSPAWLIVVTSAAASSAVFWGMMRAPIAIIIQQIRTALTDV